MSSQRLASARFKLAFQRPYLSAAIWALVPIPKPGLGTLAVDKYWRLYYDPEYVDDDSKWSTEELVSVLYHEVNHLLRDHMTRGEGKDKMIANIAADAEINESITEEGNVWSLPKGHVMPSHFTKEQKKLFERYYELLQQMADKMPQGSGEPTGGSCGSAAHGGQDEHEDGPPSEGEGSSGGIGKTEGDLLRKQVAKDTAEAARSRGTVPDHLKRWAEEELTEKHDWRREFGAELRRAIAFKRGAKDYTLQRMSRRSSGDVVLPSVHQPVPNVAAIIDTSGSMSSSQVEQCVAEIAAMLKTAVSDNGMTVLAVDADVHATARVFKRSDINPIGGGGTDMRIGIVAAEKLRPTPDIIVVLTDGETPWPDNPTKARMIVCLLPHSYGGSYIDQTPSWAKTISIDWE